METNHEYKGFLGCFPDIIGAHKVCDGPLLLRVGEQEDLQQRRWWYGTLCLCSSLVPAHRNTESFCEIVMLIFKIKNT